MPALEPLIPLGVQLQSFPLRLKHVRDLCRIGRPLLALYETAERKAKYLEVWVDRDDNTERWLIFRVGERELLLYLHQVLTLRTLVKEAVDGYVFVKDDTADGERTSLVPLDELPGNLLPRDGSLFNPKFDPSPTPGTGDR